MDFNKIKNPLLVVFFAVKNVLAEKHYKFLFVFLFIVFILAFIFVPALLIPGNSVGFQLSLYKLRDFVLFAVLSVINSLFVSMQIYLFIRSRKRRRAVVAMQGGVGAFSGFFGGLLATAACSSCVAAILGFLGAGSIFFILENQPYVVVGAIALVVIGLYFSARRVIGVCKDCEVSKQHFQK